MPLPNAKLLKGLSIPASVRYIGCGITIHCNNLKAITVDHANPIYDSREECNGVVETATDTLIAGCNTTTLPDSLISIGNSAFSGFCFETLPLNDFIQDIGDYAFAFCCNLKEISLPSSVKKLGSSAFARCINLTSAILPSVEDIRSFTFGVKSLSEIAIPHNAQIHPTAMGCDVRIKNII